MKIETDVKLETMHRDDESREEYLSRLRTLALRSAVAVVEGMSAVETARSELQKLRHSGATLAACNDAFDKVLRLSRELATAKYEREHIEYTLAEAYVRVSR